MKYFGVYHLTFFFHNPQDLLKTGLTSPRSDTQLFLGAFPSGDLDRKKEARCKFFLTYIFFPHPSHLQWHNMWCVAFFCSLSSSFFPFCTLVLHPFSHLYFHEVALPCFDADARRGPPLLTMCVCLWPRHSPSLSGAV